MNSRSASVFYAIVNLTICLVLFSPSRLTSQQFANNEFTVGSNFQTFGSATCTPIPSTPFCKPGTDHYLTYPTASFTYTRNLSPSLALEGTVEPTSQFLKTNALGSGRETVALGGVRTGWRGQRWGLYGKIQAGIASFSCATWDNSPTYYSNCARLTNFALEYGGIAEYRLGSRWALRLDAGHLLVAEYDQVLERESNALYFREGETMQHLDLRLGISRSFGPLHDAKSEPAPRRAAWDTGVLFALQPRVQPEFNYLNNYSEWGLWTSWNFSRHLSWDTALLHSPRNPGPELEVDYQSGGRAFEALTGLKIGIRRDHMGYFGKIRGGTITFGQTERQLYRTPSGSFGFDDGMFTNPVLDTGGVLEVYPSRHTILRFDAGSATIFYQPKNVISFGQPVAIPAQTQTGLMLGFGAGFRF